VTNEAMEMEAKDINEDINKSASISNKEDTEKCDIR
jgi:hypothetical protein